MLIGINADSLRHRNRIDIPHLLLFLLLHVLYRVNDGRAEARITYVSLKRMTRTYHLLCDNLVARHLGFSHRMKALHQGSQRLHRRGNDLHRIDVASQPLEST